MKKYPCITEIFCDCILSDFCRFVANDTAHKLHFMGNPHVSIINSFMEKILHRKTEKKASFYMRLLLRRPSFTMLYNFFGIKNYQNAYYEPLPKYIPSFLEAVY